MLKHAFSVYFVSSPCDQSALIILKKSVFLIYNVETWFFKIKI